MKLTRITKIRHRVFRDFAWPNDLHAFGQFNLIYGWNGCGKTTLSSLLSLVEKRTALSEGEVELEFDGTTKITGSAFTSAQLPQVGVLNRDFIKATFLSAGGISLINCLGEDSGRVFKADAKNAESLASEMTALANARGVALRDTLRPKLISGELHVSDAERIMEDISS